jgi:hypothetical protein
LGDYWRLTARNTLFRHLGLHGSLLVTLTGFNGGFLADHI